MAQSSITSNTSAVPGVEAIVSMRAIHPESRAPQTTALKLNVDAQSGWRSTGLAVVAGDTLHVEASGTSTLADGRSVSPLGGPRGWKDLLRQFPLNGANTGALLGRVSDDPAAVPFVLPAAGKVSLPSSGMLWVRMNLSDDLAGDGVYKLSLQLETAAAGPSQATIVPVTAAVTPASFNTLPRRVEDKDGVAGDVVNFALLGTDAQVNDSFSAAGWVAVDRTVQDAVLHGLVATLGHEAYTAMPMSTLYLFGRPQDLSFARGDPLKVAAERHHLRLWKSGTTLLGRTMWIGAATHDIGFERDQRNGSMTHRIDPEIDAERDFLLHSFDAAGRFNSAAYLTPVDAIHEARTATGEDFHTDGRILVMELK